MEANFLAQSRSLPLTLGNRRFMCKTRYPCVVGVLTRPADHVTEETRKTTVYKDNWFDRLAINYLSKCVQESTGFESNKSGYEGLVEAARVASQKFNPIQQRKIVAQALDRAFPKSMLALISAFPQSKFKREYFAIFTTFFFTWLIGPCKVKESELNGQTEKNVVHIKKCRFLEETNCVGMCTNLCKIPSQSFIKECFGMPLNMVPNFDEMSCEMIFGQDPPAIPDDPALRQPCYKLCKANQRHSMNCTD